MQDVQRSFFDVFKRYNPDEKKRALLERATGASFKYSKDPMRVEVRLEFPAHEDAELLYEIDHQHRNSL